MKTKKISNSNADIPSTEMEGKKISFEMSEPASKNQSCDEKNGSMEEVGENSGSSTKKQKQARNSFCQKDPDFISLKKPKKVKMPRNMNKLKNYSVKQILSIEEPLAKKLVTFNTRPRAQKKGKMALIKARQERARAQF